MLATNKTLSVVAAVFVCAPLLTLSACSTPAASSTKSGEIQGIAPTLFEAPFLLDLGDGALVKASRGYLFVPEQRDKPNGPTVAVSYIRLPSTADRPATPVFWLFGGPGSSPVTDVLEAAARASKGEADRNGQSILAMLEDMRSVSDVVLVDQRGAGLSLPRMTCPTGGASEAIELDVVMSATQRQAAYRDEVESCRQHWVSLGRSLEGYSAFELADDVNDLRAAFGYEKISLYGISFGSQWSFTTLRRHPEIIERVLLNGLEGVDHTFDMPSGVLASIERILAAAEADPAVAAIAPQDGFLAAVEAAIARLEAAPAMVAVEHPKDETIIEVAISADDFRRAWWRPVGRRQRDGAAGWPYFLAQVLDGDLRPIAQAKLQNAAKAPSGVTPRPSAMSIAIDCSLYPSGPREDELLADRAKGLIGEINERYFAVCDQLALPKVSESFLAPLNIDIPALFFHGTWDTQTPLENALQIAPGFSDAHLIVVDGAGHTVLRDVYATNPDTAGLTIKQFLRGEAIEGAPARVTLPALDYGVSEN